MNNISENLLPTTTPAATVPVSDGGRQKLVLFHLFCPMYKYCLLSKCFVKSKTQMLLCGYLAGYLILAREVDECVTNRKKQQLPIWKRKRKSKNDERWNRKESGWGMQMYKQGCWQCLNRHEMTTMRGVCMWPYWKLLQSCWDSENSLLLTSPQKYFADLISSFMIFYFNQFIYWELLKNKLLKKNC